MNQPNPVALDEATIARTLQAYREASAAGRSAESEQLLVRVAERAPGHPAVLNELGLVMMSRNEYEKAYSLFSRAAQTDASSSIRSKLVSRVVLIGSRRGRRPPRRLIFRRAPVARRRGLCRAAAGARARVVFQRC